LEDAFQSLEDGGILIIHVDKQNAGLLVYRGSHRSANRVVFEAFEVSPKAEDVLKSKGTLQWDLPTSSAAISTTVFEDRSFQRCLANFLPQAGLEAVTEFLAVTRKAGSDVSELRDTTNPALITSLLITLIEGVGQPVVVSPIRKRVRDEVLWTERLAEKKGANERKGNHKGDSIPWRRSPFWLLLRVGVLRHLTILSNPKMAQALYKIMMCLIHANLLNESISCLSPETSHLLLTKLCRRLAKVEHDESFQALDTVRYSSSQVRSGLEKQVAEANRALRIVWNSYKQRNSRRIHPLRRRVAAPMNFTLSLTNSSQHLTTLSEPFSKNTVMDAYVMPIEYRKFMKHYCELTDIESRELSNAPPNNVPSDSIIFEKILFELSGHVHEYLSVSGDSYAVGTEERSRMILTTMWMWMIMDKSLNHLFPALEGFKPVFQASILDCLRLSNQHDLHRLLELQRYLHERHSIGPSCLTIFDNPIYGCFAEKHYDRLPSDSELHQLLQTIETKTSTKVQMKQDEWAKLDSQHKMLVREIAAMTCQYALVGDLMFLEHLPQSCQKCALTRKAERIRVERFEKPLPSHPGEWKAVLFELLCPKPFSAYRDATWRIVTSLGLPGVHPTAKEPLTSVHDYYGDIDAASFEGTPRTWKELSLPPLLTLASKTKSFHQTHYRYLHFPVLFDEVCVNNGLRFEFYDTASKTWPAEHLRAITFNHHCAIPIPQASGFSKIEYPSQLMERVDIQEAGPKFIAANAVFDSNEVLAEQPRCPTGLGIQEFIAFQGLICGINGFWPALLIEMGSSNLNFSSEAVMLLLSSLCARTGSEDYHGLHTQTTFFQDDTFCNALASQIDKRLEAVRSNWRENCSMEILVTLILKLLELGPVSVQAQALRLLSSARDITIQWTRLLRKEYWSTVNASASHRLSHLMLWAALLCKRTFAYYESQINSSNLPLCLDSSSLSVFIEASISVQENLPKSPADLPRILQNLLIRDVQTVYRLQGLLRCSLERSPQSMILGAARADIVSERQYHNSTDQFAFITKTNGVWALVKLDTKQEMDAQDVEFHLLSGVLLVDGKPVQRELPLEYRNSEAIRQVFPFQRLSVNPSSLRGMTYKLGTNEEGHEVHIGFRGRRFVIRAYAPGRLLEFIPTSIYQNQHSFDLPAPLVENCVHWLNILENVIEVRRATMIWRSHDSNWRINMSSRTASRYQGMHTLIDSRSNLFNHIAGTFRGFEEPRHVVLYQPRNGALLAALPRYDLTFYVNSNGLLESQELHAEIDPNQDAGVWYGLVSKIVLRDIHNPQERSMIVPLGIPAVERKGVHVEVHVKPATADAHYGRYFLDTVLGRVTCATEPRLFYTQALLHGLTSFCLPDSLTGETGTEEACHILKSGCCQPYTPLTAPSMMILDHIASLTPVRKFYPSEKLRVMETVTWNTKLTTGIQDDRFKHLVDLIRAKSDHLLRFELNNKRSAEMPLSCFSTQPGNKDVGDVNNDYLIERSQNRRQMFQRQQFKGALNPISSDKAYHVRGCAEFGVQQSHVFQASHLLWQWASRLPSPGALLLMMQTWPSIEGFGDGTLVYDELRLSKQLDTDLALSWGSLVNLFKLSGEDAKYKLLFLTACICFKKDLSIHAIQVLIAFAVLQDLKSIDLPSWPRYTQFRPGFIPKPDYFEKILSPSGKEASAVHLGRLTQREQKALNASNKAHDAMVKQQIKELAESLCDQWPCAQPLVDETRFKLIDHEEALSLILPEYHAMFQSYEFEQHLRQVQTVLDKFRAAAPKRDLQYGPRKFELVIPRFAHLNPATLLKQVIGLRVESRKGISFRGHASESLPSLRETNELRQIIAELPQSRSIVRSEYVRGLHKSIRALEMVSNSSAKLSYPLDLEKLDLDVAAAQSEVQQWYKKICSALSTMMPGSEWIQNTELWPMSKERALLETLGTSHGLEMDESVRFAIIHLGLLITRWQRLLRIRNAAHRKKDQLLEDELKNLGHTNWSPTRYPDWLLLEIEANILIRPVQADVALATISGASGGNSVLQLNMSQGKTSIIIPMVASVLANGSSLCRIIVPKALLLQTAQLVQSRLGGLLQRELSHVPFCRKTPCTRDTIKAYAQLHIDMLRKHGVIITLPEHLMSFILSGPQQLSDKRVEEATRMIQFQTWLRKNCRDVLDECDFTMSVKTQLVYPSGTQATVDGAKYRWETIEAILHVVESHLHGLQVQFSSSIQVVYRQQGGFPFVYFLRSDAQDALMHRIVLDICSGKTNVLKIEAFSVSERRSIKIFMSEPRPPKNVTECVANISRGNPAAGFVIYLVRGLIVHRILLLCLSRRWNVQYGLHPTRDPVAVPFHAKGIPSNLAEWGHVDVSLLFTCLSFYYQGLSQDQLRKSLEQILKSDEPAREFEDWIQGSESLSGQYRDWTALNPEDVSQLECIWRHARFNKAAIDYFLNNFVFPKYAKQFQVKLQASGWDLPLKGSGGNITTGFSGTNDNRLSLPLTIRQQDLPALAHTNAEVLTYLLHHRNRGYSLLGRRIDMGGRMSFCRFSEEEFLSKLRYKNIKILIDAGAAILEMTNHDLAKKWLEIDTIAPAAIYFDENNRAMVTYRGRKTLPLLASPFANNLGDCLVYLDESHTRGTDLKLPPGAHGAVTLSLGQTNDQTMQAVMRLRQLGSTQRVTFFAPPEVHQSIIYFRGKTAWDHIDSHDVICWLLEQTIQGLENLQPLFYAQGTDFCRRSQAKLDYPDFLTNGNHQSSYLKVLQDPEQQTLKSLYDPRLEKSGRGKLPHHLSGDSQIATFVRELERNRRAFQDTGNAVHASALQEVEQEREVAVEAQTIRERQKPQRFYPQSFSGLDDDIREFVNSGELRTGNMTCQQAFQYMNTTNIGKKYKLNLPMNSKLFVSLEFRKTVYTPSGNYHDNFLRHTHYILWSETSDTAVLVSPEEQELLVPLCRTAVKKSVHLLSYAAPTTRKMLQFNDLKYYAIPPLRRNWVAPLWLQIQVGLFSGRLYFPFEELTHMLEFLGIPEDTTSEWSSHVQKGIGGSPLDGSEKLPDHLEEIDLNAQPGSIQNKQSQAQLTRVKTLGFLQEWLSLRAKGQDFTQTPMGYVCSGKVLTKDHPFFRGINDEVNIRAPASSNDVPINLGQDKDVEDDEISDFDYDDLHERQKLTEEEMKNAEALKDGEDIFVDAEEYFYGGGGDDDDNEYDNE